MRLKEDRSGIVIILLSIITLGIYGLFFIHGLAKDTNTACAKDGRNTIGLLLYIVLSIVTGGIFSIIWMFLIIDRWNNYLEKNNTPKRITGVGYILWSTIGCFIVIGPLVAFFKTVHTMNDVAAAYNRNLA